MNLKILQDIHPIIAEAWEMGLDPDIDGNEIVLSDPLMDAGDSDTEREKKKLNLSRRIKGEAAAVRAYLRSVQGLMVKIESEKLGETVWIVGHKKLMDKIPAQEVGYFPQEVMRIKKANWSDENLKKIHSIKKIFGGTIESIKIGAAHD